jgi:hypothetical protein
MLTCVLALRLVTLVELLGISACFPFVWPDMGAYHLLQRP